jgi:hypothetical protein
MRRRSLRLCLLLLLTLGTSSVRAESPVNTPPADTNAPAAGINVLTAGLPDAARTCAASPAAASPAAASNARFCPDYCCGNITDMGSFSFFGMDYAWVDIQINCKDGSVCYMSFSVSCIGGAMCSFSSNISSGCDAV